MLKIAGAGQYGIKGAEVIAIGAAQGFSWTVTIDVGANDGIKRDMTVLNGDGLVGRVTTVGPEHRHRAARQRPRLHRRHPHGGRPTSSASPPVRATARCASQLLNGKAKVQEGRPAGHLRLAGRQAVRARRPGRRGRPASTPPAATSPAPSTSRRTSASPSSTSSASSSSAPQKDPRDTVLPRQAQADPHADGDRHGHPVRERTAPTASPSQSSRS